MANLTSKEFSALTDELDYEAVLVKKYRSYSAACQDSVLKEKCAQIADRHQQHFNTLLSLLQ